MKLQRTHLVSHMSHLMRLVVMVCIGVFLIWSMMLIDQASNTVQASITESSTYQQISSTLAKEQVLLYEYALDPSPAIYAHHQTMATTLVSLVYRLQQDSDLGDDLFERQFLAEQSRYAVSSTSLFSAINAHDLARATFIRSTSITPAFERLKALLDRRSQVETTALTASLAQLNHIEQMTALVGPVLLGISLLLMGVGMWVSRSYQRKMDEATQAELTRFQQLALTDPLTHLGNHYAFQEQLAAALGQPNASMALALLNLDDFKLLNDEQGHQRGDEILRDLGAMLAESMQGGTSFRLGADSFAVLLPNMAVAQVTLALEQLCQQMSQQLLTVTVSIGLTSTHVPGVCGEELQAQAEVALQAAKQQGRNRVVSFHTIEHQSLFVPLAKRQAVRRLLGERKMTVAFQPIWNLASGTILAFEALSRPDASYGLSGPQELFDIAEQMGRAHELDVVCVQNILARAGKLPADTLLFLNLTPQTLVHDLLTEATLLQAVVSAGLQPSQVVLEITERSIVNLANLVQKVKLLQLLGFRVALDDAGAGNAGLEMLSQLPVDFIKIDREVVSRALTDSMATSILAAITTIAQSSQAVVIAEGIETQQMLALVQRHDVPCAQGYLLGRPSETIAVPKMLPPLSPLQPTSSC